jgi:hypothetical protein
MPDATDFNTTTEGPIEEVLEGGGVNIVSRVGNTVRRPARSWIPAVRELLRHLREEGFEGFHPST